jgi:hypothetical protein
MPLNDVGWSAQMFREAELTGTKVISVSKADIFVFVLVLLFGFAYWSFFWKSSQIPSSQYPYSQAFWPISAFYQSLWATATHPSADAPKYLLDALKFEVIGAAGGSALALYIGMMLLKIPSLWFYGFASGFYNMTWWAIPLFVGGCLGKYYFSRRFGPEKWMRYTPVLAAGYTCGIGLIGMVSIGLTIIFKAVRSLPF